MHINNHTAVAEWPSPLTSLSNLYTRNHISKYIKYILSDNTSRH